MREVVRVILRALEESFAVPQSDNALYQNIILILNSLNLKKRHYLYPEEGIQLFNCQI